MPRAFGFFVAIKSVPPSKLLAYITSSDNCCWSDVQLKGTPVNRGSVIPKWLNEPIPSFIGSRGRHKTYWGDTQHVWLLKSTLQEELIRLINLGTRPTDSS